MCRVTGPSAGFEVDGREQARNRDQQSAASTVAASMVAANKHGGVVCMALGQK